MEDLKIGLLAIGALAFAVVGMVFQDVVAVIAALFFSCGVALAIWGFRVGD